MTVKHTRIGAALCFASSLAVAQSTRAAIFASVDLEQNIQYELPNSSTDVYAPVSNKVVPFNTTLSLNTGNGAMISSTYNIYDNGSSAGLSINTSATCGAENTGLGEETQLYHYANKQTSFSFTEPVDFTLIVSGTESVVNGNAVGGGAGQLQPFNSFATEFGLPTTAIAANYSQSFTGVLSPGGPCDFDEYLDFGNPSTATSNVPPVYATESIVLTFTPVPEPSSAVLAAAAAAGTYRRRRRAVGRRIVP